MTATQRAAMQQVLNDLEAVLCDPDGRCCIDGSSWDRAIVDRALSTLRAALAEPVQGAVNRDDIIRMAREAGCQEHYVSETDDTPWSVEFSLTNLNVFADLVAAAERAACAGEGG